MRPFAVRRFNPCESLLRHSPEQLRTFLRRMKTLNLNTMSDDPRKICRNIIQSMLSKAEEI